MRKRSSSPPRYNQLAADEAERILRNARAAAAAAPRISLQAMNFTPRHLGSNYDELRRLQVGLQSTTFALQHESNAQDAIFRIRGNLQHDQHTAAPSGRRRFDDQTEPLLPLLTDEEQPIPIPASRFLQPAAAAAPALTDAANPALTDAANPALTDAANPALTDAANPQDSALTKRTFGQQSAAGTQFTPRSSALTARGAHGPLIEDGSESEDDEGAQLTDRPRRP